MKPRMHWQLVTGRLAEAALRVQVERLRAMVDAEFTISTLPITVAALMTPRWIARHLVVEATVDKILLPGYCDTDLSPLSEITNVPIVIGPKDLAELSQFFGRVNQATNDLGPYTTEIIAEINHAPRWSREELLREADELRNAGANVIDVGCEPAQRWLEVGDCVRALRDRGHRVSIDSFDPLEVRDATNAGAELVLSVNRTNREAAVDWGCEVVVIPDDPAEPATMEPTIEWLDQHQVAWRADPILEPIGFGFGSSLLRYAETRRRFPDARMLMGIGNVTELSDCDSAGLNFLLLALCAEWRIESVLTTQVISWAQSSVRECAIARQLVHHAITQHRLPKHLSTDLLLLRDPGVVAHGAEFLAQLARDVRDPNFRLFAENGALHIVSAGLYLSDSDPFVLFEKLLESSARKPDAPHAFYLGYELCKARIALTLGKQYRQDDALRWGFLTREETTHGERVERREERG